jgi:hypothetical protein
MEHSIKGPHHWYNIFCAALKDIGLEQSVHDPCLFSGNLKSDNSPTSKSKLHVGIYVDDFVFYLEDPEGERPFNSSSKRITIYHDNQAAVDWAASCTNKGTKHINLCENYVRKRHQRGITKVTHIPGVINATDLFTKELKDAAHFTYSPKS